MSLHNYPKIRQGIIPLHTASGYARCWKYQSSLLFPFQGKKISGKTGMAHSHIINCRPFHITIFFTEPLLTDLSSPLARRVPQIVWLRQGGCFETQILCCTKVPDNHYLLPSRNHLKTYNCSGFILLADVIIALVSFSFVQYLVRD